MLFKDCTLCPRKCGTDRTKHQRGYCQLGAGLVVSSICLHTGEEPVFTGSTGVCNIFFPHCNLQCIYCQNYQISSNTSPVRVMELPEIVSQVSAIVDSGVKCVGFVSPSHVVPRMIEIIKAIERTGRKPVYVMNTNSYDRKETLEMLEGIIDVYLADFKYSDDKIAQEYSGVENYSKTGVRALREMYRQKGANIVVGENGIIESGLVIRHLILPNHIDNSIKCLRIISEELSTSVHVSLMSQYNPIPAVTNHPMLHRVITCDEYKHVVDEFYKLGFTNGWLQEMGSNKDYIPNFLAEYPFA